MAKKSKLPTKKERKRATRRTERRFISQASTNVTIVRAIGAISALLLGAGVWAYFYGQSFAADEKLKQIPAYLIAAGAVLMGVTIWIGTSSEPPVRVGDPGIALEKGELRRMAWWAVEKITFESGSLALVVTGKDESNVDWTFKLSMKSHAEAIGWLVKEALERIPRRVDIGESVLDALPGASEYGGQKIELEPLQVVGKRCAITGKTISYEPDARTCPRCERVYQKDAVPKKCKCGNALAHLRPKDAPDTDEPDDEPEDEDARSKDEADLEERDASSSGSEKLVAATEET